MFINLNRGIFDLYKFHDFERKKKVILTVDFSG